MSFPCVEKVFELAPLLTVLKQMRKPYPNMKETYHIAL